MVRLATVVQTHPDRVEVLPRLLPLLDDPLVVTDPGGAQSNAWRCYRQCLRADVGDATHLLIVQDDAVPCSHFTASVLAAIEARPNAAIAFFVSPQCRRSSHAMTMALKKREPWADWSRADFWPTVASAYPIGVARALADWVDAKKPDSRGDDAPCGDYFRTHPGTTALLAVPSLVQHPDDVPSLIGRKYMSGKNPARLAKYFIGEKDARTISW